MKKKIIFFIILLFLPYLALQSQAKLGKTVIGLGGGASSNQSCILKATIGESFIGIAQNNQVKGYFGFWYKMYTSEGDNKLITIAPSYILPGTKSISYQSEQFSAFGGMKPYTFTATGLPSGLTMLSSGIISGIPTVGGSFSVTIIAIDANGQSGTKVIHFIILTSPCYSLDYPTRAKIPTGGRMATFVAAEDLNNDGNLDAITANGLSDNISVMLGNGNGEFTAPINCEVSYFPWAIAISDFDGDGNRDLAVCNSSYIDILKGKGDGTFLKIYTYSGVDAPKTIDAEDFNGDGKLDLIVSNVFDYVSIFYGAGDGSFGDPLTINTGTGSSPWASEIGDFNLDGLMDFATANSGTNNISIYRSDGSGGFLTPLNFSVGSTPRYLTASDINRDDMLDIIVSNNSSNSISILYGDGTGNFVNQVQYDVGIQPNCVLVQDLNSDGYKDIAVSNYMSTSITIYQGNCMGTFGSRKDYQAGIMPRFISSGDFNKDGKIDIVIANRVNDQIMSLLINSCGLEPLARCNDITVALVDNSASITPEDINDGSTKECNGISISVSPNTFNCSNLGPNTVTLTVTDPSGSSTQCQANVTVIDNTPPAIICNVCYQNQYADPGACTYTHIGTDWDASATDNCSLVSNPNYELTGATTGSGTSLSGVKFNYGKTTVEWSCSDPSGNKDSYSFDVSVSYNTATILVFGALHTTGAGKTPTAKKVPLAFDLRIFDRTGMAYNPKDFPSIWSENTQLSASLFSIIGPTEATYGGGPVEKYTITLPASCSDIGNNGYLVIGKATIDGSDFYVGNSTSSLTNGSSTNIYLQVIRNANGKKVPATTTEVIGSLLLIAEPAYLEFTTSEELLPIVYESIDGEWSVKVSAEPPEGFVSTPGSLSTDVTTSDMNAVQFTVKDIGSKWTNTKVTHKIKHKGKDCEVITNPGMINKQPKKKDAEFNGTEDISGNSVEEEIAVRLKQNYPNPFAGLTELQYFVSKKEHVTLVLTDIGGRVVANLVDRYVNGGWNTLIVNGSGLTAGTYFLRLESMGKAAMMKIVKAD